MIRMIKWRRTRFVGHVARMEGIRNAYKRFGEPEKKRPFGRPRPRYEANVLMHLKRNRLGKYEPF